MPLAPTASGESFMLYVAPCAHTASTTTRVHFENGRRLRVMRRGGRPEQRVGIVLSWLFAWWLIYYNGEHWIFHRSFSTQSLCTTAAENLQTQGITARCAEIRGW